MNTLVRIGIGLGKGACWYTRPFVGHVRYKSSKAGGMKSRRRTDAKERESKTFGLGAFSNLKKPSEEMVNSSKEQIKSVESFDELKIFPTVRVSMIKEIKKSYNFKNTYIKNKDELEIKPSPVQIASIKKISRPRDQVPMKHNKPKPSTSGGDIFSELMKENNNKKLKIFTIAAETGSGKTWAYLASVLSKLKEDDLSLFNESPRVYSKTKNSPIIRSVILLPTHELVEQVYETLDSANKMKYDVSSEISATFTRNNSEFFELHENKDHLNLNIFKWGSGDPQNKLKSRLDKRGRIDVLVTTPAKINTLKNPNADVSLSRAFKLVNYCVVDEADTLMDQSWSQDTLDVLGRFKVCRDLIFCSATIPQDFDKTIKGLFGQLAFFVPIITPSLHKIPKQIVVKVLDSNLAPFNGSKTRCLAQALYAIHNDGSEAGYVKRIVIFVNQKKSVHALVETLTDKYGHRPEDIIGVTGENSPEDRLAQIKPFIEPAQLIEEDLDGSKIKVLVTTDLMARGINFNGVKNIILMEIPNSSLDLVHRIGRTGRMRQSGRVFIIIDGKKTWIKGLPRAIKNNMVIA
ncbi:ATP-dependent RNA helicase MRH4, mitochondrial [Hyphopichia burtonii NRRL Y-1933]|uniref:ATP-dependent RNA helicase n=1 Tax=Hyphopichia burtonii NRRL Y-1933 TaxID=984485 RepID=A0A1E4RBM4_9ASCO|nr:ATP-dependent RNA helicase MRH4, mitochondrial [Hyphopichia burtonii NRRL Y-1933]ODV64667.1 ATP-dependent RNA helicase MRH4, mitochondrial [Hyphopichia burtonii NRRL Y-1933]